MPTTVFPPVPVVFSQIVMNGNVSSGGSNNKAAAFVFNWRRTATVAPVVKSQVELSFNTSVAVPILAALNSRYTQRNNAVRWANDSFDQPAKFTRVGIGSIVGDSMPTSMSAYLLMSSGLRGGFFRGSKHLFPLSESDTTIGTDDVWNAGALARLATIAAAILAGFTDAGGNVWVPVVIGGIGSNPVTTNQRTNPNTITYANVVLVAIQPRVGTMRHRKVKPL